MVGERKELKMKWFLETFKVLITIVVILIVLLVFFGCNSSKNIEATEKNIEVSLIKFNKEEQKWQDLEVEGEDIGLGQKVVQGIRLKVEALGSVVTELREEE